MKKIIIGLIGALSLTGCHIYKNYERPAEVVVSDSLFRLPFSSDDTTSVASLSWKEFFTDPYLQRLIDTAICNNTDLQIAALKIKEAEATLTSSKLSFLPYFTFDPQGNISRFDGGSTQKSYALNVSAGWDIDLFGKLRNAKKNAETVLFQNQASSQAVHAELVAMVAGSYYTLLMLDKQLEISKRTVENWGDYIRVLKALKKNSTVNEVAIAQAEADKIKVEASLLTIEQQILSVENSLSAILGKKSGVIERGKLDEQRFLSEISVGVPLQLLRNRPDIRLAEWQLAQAYYVTNEARAAFYPSVTLGGTVGWTNSGGGVIVNPGGWLLTAVGNLVQPLFNRGENIARLKISKAQQEEALLYFKQSILDAGVEVNDALTQWQTARKRLELDEKQIDALSSALKNTTLLMKYGTTNYLEVLVAQQSLLQSELTMVEDRFNEIQGVISLYNALGGGVF